MLEKIKKTTKYTAYAIIITALLLVYYNNQQELNNFAQDLWQTSKKFISYFAVVPEYQPITTNQNQPKKEPQIILPKKIEEELNLANITYTIKQTKSGKQSFYGYDAKYNLVAFTDGQKKAIIEYNPEEKISKITSGNRKITLNYNPRGELTQIIDNEQATKLKYGINGQLKSIETPYEKLAFFFDDLGKLMTYKRGEGYETKFTYNKNKLDSYLKDGTTTKVTFNSKGQLKTVLTDDSHLIINYGKDDFISYLAGIKYGLAETISYNTNDETITSATDDSQFTGETEPARINALNLYLTCIKFKRTPVMFDPLAYVLYTSYFKQDIVYYLTNNLVCDTVYGREI